MNFYKLLKNQIWFVLKFRYVQAISDSNFRPSIYFSKFQLRILGVKNKQKNKTSCFKRSKLFDSLLHFKGKERVKNKYRCLIWKRLGTIWPILSRKLTPYYSFWNHLTKFVFPCYQSWLWTKSKAKNEKKVQWDVKKLEP